MPHVDFASLPPDARVWVFGARAELDDAARTRLLHVVDEHLSQWRAHGVPLTCSRDYRDNRFVAIGVDEAATGASGCSIDGLFRTLQLLQDSLGTSLVGGGTMFYRDAEGVVQSTDRDAFNDAIKSGVVTASTPVFDLTIGTVGDWRSQFEKPAGQSWHARLLRQAGSVNGLTL